MFRKYVKPAMNEIRQKFSALFFFVIALSICACSSTPKINLPDRSGFNLKKRVCVTYFEDRKRFDDAYLHRSFQDQLTDALKLTCKKPVFIFPGQNDFPKELDTLPMLESGLVDNMALVDIGREHGFNAIVTGSISDVRLSDESGWLSGDQSYTQVMITAEIYDTQTGAKLMDKGFLREIEVDVAKASESEKEGEYFDITAIEKVFKRIVKDMRNDICKIVSDLPWKGFIVAANGDSVIISAGKKVGLKSGNRLNVYENDQIMVGAYGNRFRIPGPKIGELKLVSVSDDRSEAVLIEGKGAIPGNSVRLK